MKRTLLFPLASLIAISGHTAYQDTSPKERLQSAAVLTEPSLIAENEFESSGLNAGMTDAEILAYFGLDIDCTESLQVQGKDGIQTTYISGERRVSIVRSQVSGLAVVAEGTDSAGAWSLDKHN